MISKLRLIVLVALVSYPASAAVVVKIVPPSQNALVGTAVSLQVAISGLGAAGPPAVGAYDLNIGFDPTVLQFTGAVFGDPTLGDQLDPLSLGTVSSATPGVAAIDVFELSLDSVSSLNNLQAPAFALVTLTFQATGTGTSPVTININALSDASGNALTGTTQNGSVTISQPSPTPVLTPVLSTPAFVSFALLLAALGAIVMRTRRTEGD